MKVPLIDLRAQYASMASELNASVQRVLESGHYIMGNDVIALEREISEDARIEHGVAVSSGTDALLAALWAIGIGPGDEVITTALSFFATAGAIARLGATPVFADVDPLTFNLDPQSALERVTKHSRAFIPVHLFGRPADIEPLRQAGLPIIEDAAQAIGSPALGRVGNVVTLSFFPSKNLGAAGDAGMALTNDAALADRMRLYRAHGARPKYVHHVVGANLRMDTLQAAILRVKRPYLNAWNERRRHNATRYHEMLSGTPLVLPNDAAGHVWHHFVVRAPMREQLRAFLREREIETEVYYPQPLHLQPCFTTASVATLPHSEAACREVLALPLHPALEEAQLNWVAQSIRDFYAVT